VNANLDAPDKDNSAVAPHGSVTNVDHAGTRLHRILRLLSAFFMGQGALQGVGVLASLYLLRVLSVESYAEYGLAIGFQTAVATLMDFGLASTIIPLVGERFEDRGLVGRYVRGARHLRDLSFWLMSPVVAAAFLLICSKHHWPVSVQFLLLFSILLSLLSTGKISYFSAPLFLYRKFRSYYVPQTLSALARLTAYVAIGTAGLLNASGAALLSAFSVTANGWLVSRESKKYFELPDHNDARVEKEIIHFIVPAVPAILLGAFHGQISLLLISIFGLTTGIAEVAALGRLSQLFVVLMTFNIVVIEPYVARLPERKLRGAYLKLLAIGAAATLAVSTFAFLAPGIFLWLLGPHYRDLRSLIGWVILTACINYLAGLLWIMNRSRKWVFWRGSILEITLVFIVQIGFLILVGVRTTRDAVFFNFASSFCYIITHGYIAFYGHSRGTPIDASVMITEIRADSSKQTIPETTE
jgi:O-antigen/teichoic acid export membrane protein